MAMRGKWLLLLMMGALPGYACAAAGEEELLDRCRWLDGNPEAQPEEREACLLQVVTLLQQGANPLREDAEGYNAMVYLNGAPETLDAIGKQVRLPKELMVRLPHEPRELLNYMRLRNAQAAAVRNPGSLDYLRRRYFFPAYARVEALFQQLLRKESARQIPAEGLESCLEFLRLADDARTRSLVDGLALWEHSEHFLEEVPMAFLQALQKEEWAVGAQQLRQALRKLEKMLPASAEEMIDCAASQPMALLLEMLYRQEGDAALPDVQRFADSHDPDMACAALRILLQHQGLPTPENLSQAAGDAAHRLAQLYAVDRSLGSGEDRPSSSDLQEAAGACAQLGLRRQAELLRHLATCTVQPGQEEKVEGLLNAYLELGGSRLYAAMCRYMLAHPSLFTQP